MPQLPGLHRDLPAVMRIVRDQVTKKSGCVGTKALYPPVASERLAKNHAQRVPAAF